MMEVFFRIVQYNFVAIVIDFFWPSLPVSVSHLVDVFTLARSYYKKEDEGSLAFSSDNYSYSSRGTVHITFPLCAA